MHPDHLDGVVRHDDAAGQVRVVLPGTSLAVREALVLLRDTVLFRTLCERERGVAEIVLGEVLNNIVEHGRIPEAAVIEVLARRTPEGILCRVEDPGQPMPGGRLPPGLLDLPHRMEDLPEGGFGWFLIRQLCRNLDYRRANGRNALSFHLVSGQ